MFHFWRVPQCFVSGGFLNASLPEGSEAFRLWRVPKCLASGRFRSVSFLEGSEVECLVSGEFRS